MNLCRVTRREPQRGELRFHGHLGVDFLEPFRILSVVRPAVLAVAPVAVHSVDEEKAQHLDALGPEEQLLSQVFLHRSAHLLFLQGVRLRVPRRTSNSQHFRLRRECEVFAALLATDVIDNVPLVDVTHPGLLVEVFAAPYLDGLARHLAALVYVHFDSRRNRTARIVYRDETEICRIVAVRNRELGHLDFLDEFLLHCVDRVEPVDEYVHVFLAVRG